MKRSNGFSAGMASIILSVFVTTIVMSHGHSNPAPITWADVIWFLVIQAVIASCVIDLYKYWKDR
jgi:hypothetical protein